MRDAARSVAIAAAGLVGARRRGGDGARGRHRQVEARGATPTRPRKAGRLVEAIAHARDAAEAVVPGSPWPARGVARLEAIGHDAEARGDERTAVLAYGAMRAAAMATRAPLLGTDPWRALADEGLARVGGARARHARRGRTPAQRRCSRRSRARTPLSPGSSRLLGARRAGVLRRDRRASRVAARDCRRAPAREARAAAAAAGAIVYAVACLRA